MKLNASDVQIMSLGAHVLGGGGGGPADRGLRSAREAFELGCVELVDLTSLPDEALVVTVSGVGAPSRTASMYTSAHYLRALELMEEALQRPIAGFIPSEMGANAAFGPMLPAAVRKAPLLNAACDGRAHPLGTMGSLGLASDPLYQTIQVACGGLRENGTYTELVATGSVSTTAKLCRNAADLAGGRAVVVRNPVTVAYLREHGAVGCYTQAMELGRAMTAVPPALRPQAAAEHLGGRIAARGTVEEFTLLSENGLDHGTCIIAAGPDRFQLTFYNEFMTMEHGTERLATFPDLITAFDSTTGAVLNTADLRNGMDVTVLTVPCQRLLLSSGVRDGALYEDLERIVRREMRTFIADVLL